MIHTVFRLSGVKPVLVVAEFRDDVDRNLQFRSDTLSALGNQVVLYASQYTGSDFNSLPVLSQEDIAGYELVPLGYEDLFCKLKEFDPSYVYDLQWIRDDLWQDIGGWLYHKVDNGFAPICTYKYYDKEREEKYIGYCFEEWYEYGGCLVHYHEWRRDMGVIGVVEEYQRLRIKMGTWEANLELGLMQDEDYHCCEYRFELGRGWVKIKDVVLN